MLTAEQERDLKRLKELKLVVVRAEIQKRRYEEENRLEFFGIADDKRAEFHKDCCKIFRGPNPKQALILEAWKNPKYKVFTYTGANRIGKTTLEVIIGLSTLFGKWLWNNEPIIFPHKQPRKVRLVGQDWEKHIKTVVEPELHKWWPQRRKVTTRKNNFGVDALWVDEETKSSLELMSNNQEESLHEGWYGDLILYDEPPRREIRVANARGLIDRQGRELFCMTLLKEAWVDREVIKALNPDGTPDTSVFNVHGDISVNIGFGITKEGLEQFAKTLTEEEKDARLKGIPSYMSGLVYPTFNRQKHLIKRFKVPTDWPVDILIDIHPREKQAVLFTATDPKGYKYAVDEIWEHGDGTQIADEIVRYISRNAYRVGVIAIDPFSKGDSNNENTVYDKVQDVLIRFGHPLRTAPKDKTAGILEVKNYLMGPNNMPSLFFFDDLKRTVYEIEGYMYDKETQKPQDKDDHMMENLYRSMLCGSVYTEIQDEEEEKEKLKRNQHTGY